VTVVACAVLAYAFALLALGAAARRRKRDGCAGCGGCAGLRHELEGEGFDRGAVQQRERRVASFARGHDAGGHVDG